MYHVWVSGRQIAEQLSLNYVFFCEFEELHSPLRSPALQVMHAVEHKVTAVSQCCSSSMSQSAVWQSLCHHPVNNVAYSNCQCCYLVDGTTGAKHC